MPGIQYLPMLLRLLLPTPLLTDAVPSGVDLGVFAQYGVLGVVTLLLGWFARGAYQREKDRADRLESSTVAKETYQHERERADRLEAENQRLNTVIQDRIIPALVSATAAAEESGKVLRAIYAGPDGRKPAGRRGAGDA